MCKARGQAICLLYCVGGGGERKQEWVLVLVATQHIPGCTKKQATRAEVQTKGLKDLF